MASEKIFRIRAKDRLIGQQLESRGLSEDVKGKPLKIPQFNFTISLENKVRSMFGAPRYATRALKIENIIQKLMEDLSFEYNTMIDMHSKNPEVFTQKWKCLIGSLELDKLNDLIDKHNKYYPMEANLQIDPESGALLLGSVPWKPMEKISTDILLKIFPPYVDTTLNHDEN